MSVAALLFTLPVIAGVGVGQALGGDGGANAVTTAVGVDGAMIVGTLGYARALPMPTARTLMIGAAFSLPMTRPDLGDWRGSIGARVDVLRLGGFAWPVELDLLARRLTNHSVRAFGLGTELSTAPGWYPGRWFVAAELAWDRTWGSRLVHSAAYHTYVYEGVHDGWYRATGYTLRYGARIGGRPLRRLELWARGGYEQHGRYDTFAPPLYAIVGINVRF